VEELGFFFFGVVLDVLDHHRDLGDPLGITRLEVPDLLEKRLDDLVLLDALGDDSPVAAETTEPEAFGTNPGRGYGSTRREGERTHLTVDADE
jgi:hypothetical protein